MLAANVARGLLTGLMTMAVAGGATQLWTIYAFSVLIGTASGFAVPAENSIVPQLVRDGDLQAGNSVIMGLTQLAGFVGPSVAGAVIGHYADSLTGVAVAYAVDAITFVVSAMALLAMRGVRRPSGDPSQSLLAATTDGVRHLWHDRSLRALFAVLLAVNLLLIGPLMVGIPQLADQRLRLGAPAFGILMSAFAIGNLVGYLLAGATRRPGGAALRRIVIGLVAAFGVGIGSLGLSGSTLGDALVLAALGLGNGFMAVLLITWMQTRTPATMVGRMMSLMTLASTGLVPASEAIAGVIGAHNLTLLFVAPGVAVVLMALGLRYMPALRSVGDELGSDPGAREAAVSAAGPGTRQ
jgi:MFS family permease